MLTATVPRESGGLLGIGYGAELSELLDTVPATGSTLPCRTHDDPDLWFAEAPAELEQAKQLCGGCPVRAQCLAGALARREPWGVWGGEIFERGAVIPRKRPRGRPRNAPLAAPRPEPLVSRSRPGCQPRFAADGSTSRS